MVWFLLAQSAFGMSLYDVVQLTRTGYADQQIVDLIQATDSRFVLDPGALVVLKEANVSDTVIQALIKAKAPAAGSETPAGTTNPLSDSPHTHADTAGRGAPQAAIGRSAGDQPAPSGPAPPHAAAPSPVTGPFSSYALHEAHSSSHQHFALSVRGVPVLILRSEQGRATIEQRAQEAVERLNRLVVSPSGRFSAAHGPAPAVRYQAGTEIPATEVLRVGQGDAIAYQHWSLGQASAERLAAYWAALLNDYTQLFLFGRPPTELVSLHQGESLREIYAGLAAGKSEPEEGTPRIDVDRLLGAVDHLEAEDKEHLLEFTRRIPAEFEPR